MGYHVHFKFTLAAQIYLREHKTKIADRNALHACSMVAGYCQLGSPEPMGSYSPALFLGNNNAYVYLSAGADIVKFHLYL